ncbi:rCG48982 [Rattus norvegicus]|uniref:RCG48982 n=1 Tax=Rattus norvegicus TaxID=10116 RepID=A6IFF6_RAT|nr:rCG48982 [Rattus norvegicus]
MVCELYCGYSELFGGANIHLSMKETGSRENKRCTRQAPLSQCCGSRTRSRHLKEMLGSWDQMETPPGVAASAAEEVLRSAPQRGTPPSSINLLRCHSRMAIDLTGSHQGQPIFCLKGIYPLQYSYVSYSPVRKEIQLAI